MVAWIFYAAWIAQLLPPLAALRFRSRVPTPRRWMAGWSAGLFLADGLSLWVSTTGRQTIWLSYVTAPILDCLMLWGLSLWQTHPLARLTFRSAIPVFLAVWIGLVVGIEDTATFSNFAGPFGGVVMLSATLFTLLTRSLNEQEGVTSRDWFWIGLGVSLYFGVGSILQPIARVLLANNQDLLLLALQTRAWSDVIASVLIARGMLCPLPPAHSGGFSSLRRSRSGSFSSRSAPPS